MIATDSVTLSNGDVTFPTVTAAQDDYLVLHEVDEQGNVVAPPSISHAAAATGENTDLAVTAETGVTHGEEHIAMLYAETNGSGTYDFGEGSTNVDTPVTANDEPVRVRFTPPMEGQSASGDTATNAAMQPGDGSGGDMAPGNAAGSMMPEVVVEGARIQGDTLTLSRVVVEQDGYVEIHTVLDGEPIVPASGHMAVTAATNESVEVTVDYPFAVGESYVAMLHVESNGSGIYDFGEGSTDVETPVTVAGEIVAQSFHGG